MITKLNLENYRCYDEHEVEFKSISIVVGKNNAGKSTLIEALRLVSLVAARLITGTFRNPPKWSNAVKGDKGISPSLERIEFSIKNIIHQHNDPPAKIVAQFENQEIIEIYLNDSGSIFAIGRNSKGESVKSRNEAKELKSTNISILPQISPLLEEEKGLEESYVKSNIYSALTSRHFRNQLSYFNQHFRKFKKISEESWNGLRIRQQIKAEKKFSVVNPSLLVQEGGFVTDIGGWGGWKYAIGSKFVLKNAGDESIMIYCLLDSDYHLPSEINNRLKEAKKNGISLHIWNKKELENYLIVPSAITRLIIKKKPKLEGKVTDEIIEEKIDELCESFKNELVDDIASEIGKYYRYENKVIDFTDGNKKLKYETKNMNRVARRYVASRWGDKTSIVPGKKLIKELNIWLSQEFKISIGKIEIAKEIQLVEIDKEAHQILDHIEKVKKI